MCVLFCCVFADLSSSPSLSSSFIFHSFAFIQLFIHSLIHPRTQPCHSLTHLFISFFNPSLLTALSPSHIHSHTHTHPVFALWRWRVFENQERLLLTSLIPLISLLSTPKPTASRGDTTTAPHQSGHH